MSVSNTRRRRERCNVQKGPRRAGESVGAPRAGESDIGPRAQTRERFQEHEEKKGAATRRRELDLEVGWPPRAGESTILEHFEEHVR